MQKENGRDPFDFDPYTKLLFSANSIPRIKDKSGAVLDRLIIIPFNASFSKKDPDFDPYIKYKLRSNEAMEYLIQLGIKGLKRVVIKNSGFTNSARVEAELKEYEENNNPIIGFFNEISEDEIINEPTAKTFRKYNEYCLNNNFTPLSNIEFSRKLTKYYGLIIKSKMINGKRFKIFVKN